MDVVCRQATEQDVEGLYGIIQSYAKQGIMLPRSILALRAQIATFVVAEADGGLAGCASLCRLGEDLVEIRSLGVLEEYKGRGIGSKLVDILIEQAKELKIPRVMALTYEVGFFEKNGFKVTPKKIFPEKVWKDCVFCKKQHCCDEIAVLKQL